MCSKARHGKNEICGTSGDGFGEILDLHTFEVPISSTNYDLTVDQIGLRDCTVGGVLNLFAVTRDPVSDHAAKTSGKDAIFLNSKHWVSARPLFNA